MAFNRDKFRSASYKTRTKKHPVPQLKDFFEDKAKPQWEVRGLDGEEFYYVKSAARRAKDVKEVIEKLFSKNPKTKVEAALEVIGITEDMSEDYIQRLEMLVIGSVKPEIEKQDAVLIAKRFPMLFEQLSNEIMVLTGAGQELGESSASGQTRKSKAA